MERLKTSESILITPTIYDDEEAVAAKMKAIHPKLFGLFCPVKYRLLKKEKVLVPYMFIKFDYRIRRSNSENLNRQKMFNREGQIGIVFDMNEIHPFHFDLFDDLNLQKKNIAKTEGTILECGCNESEAIEQSRECAKWQFLKRVFHTIPDITVAKKELFYREAYKLYLSCNGKTYEKYAYMDSFGLKNEHISGLRVRLDV